MAQNEAPAAGAAPPAAPPGAAPAAPEPPPPPPAQPPPPPPPAAQPLPPAPPAQPAPAVAVGPGAPLPMAKLEGPNGSIRVGVLAQPQFSAVGAAAANSMTYNLYIRRIRLLVGGTVFRDFEYFVDTDYPNLFLANEENAAGTAFPKNAPGMNIQDAFITYKAMGDMVKVDVGFMLPPLAHNAVQGATTLYSWDYFSNTFKTNAAATGFFGASGNPVGRDLGLELRGLVAQNRLEYRVGLFQGERSQPANGNVGGNNFFRYTARLQLNLLDPETAFFYAGTYLGAKKVLSFGISYDAQSTYKYLAIDGITDLPLGPGLFTAQVNFAYWNLSNTTFVATPKQYALMGEAGYLLNAVFSPIVRAEFDHVNATNAKNTQLGLGLGWWPVGHNSNIKAFYTRILNSPVPAGGHNFNQINVQWQLYFY
jgi:hypothetical protein